MHILFLTDNFAPEANAPASRTFEHARQWVRQGHCVTVVTGVPNFPQGRVFPGYHNRWCQVEWMDGIRVVRMKTYITANQGFGRRTFDYLSFMITGFIGALRVRRPDVVVATSPQFFTAIAGWWAARWHGCPFVFEVRDLWPASIVAVGAMRPDSLVVRLLEGVELMLYHRARRVVVVSGAFIRDLTKRGIPRKKIALVVNGVDLDHFAPRKRDTDLARAWGLEGKFVVGYLGTIGMAHGLERVLEAAALLTSEPAIRLLFVGSGADRDRLEGLARDRGLTNVVFVPAQPKEQMPACWSVCDVALVHLKDDPVFAGVIPSKIFEAMGMGMPILFAAPRGEASAIIERHAVGRCIAPEKPQQLANAIVAMYADRVALRVLASNSAAAASCYDRSTLADEMAKELNEVVMKVRSLPLNGAGARYLSGDRRQ